MKQRKQFSLCMAAGEVERVLVDNGSEVVVLAGRTHLRQPPRWLAEQTICLEQTLDEGGQVLIGEGGWAEFSALENCQLLVLAPSAGVWERLLVNCWRVPRQVFDVNQGRLVSSPTESRFAVFTDPISKEP